MKNISSKRIALTALSGLLIAGCGKANAKINMEPETKIEKETESLISTETELIIPKIKAEQDIDEVYPIPDLIERINASYCDELTKSILKEIAYYTESDRIPCYITWVLDAEEYDRNYYFAKVIKEVIAEYECQNEEKKYNSSTLRVAEDNHEVHLFANYINYGSYKFYKECFGDLLLVTDINDNILLDSIFDTVNKIDNVSLIEFSVFLNTNNMIFKDEYTFKELEEINNTFNYGKSR